MENQSFEVESRRLRSALTICGGVTLIFAVWTLIKTVLTIYFTLKNVAEDQWLTAFFPDLGENPESAAMKITITVTIVIILIIMAMFVIIGIQARRQGKGKKVGFGYVVLAFVLLVLSLFLDVSTLLMVDPRELFEYIILVVLDLTSDLSVLIIIVTAIKLRKLEKTAAVQGV